MKKFAVLTILAACILALLVGCSARNAELENMTTEVTNDYESIIWEDNTYVPYCAISPDERGKQIGFIDEDASNKIYEYKDYSSDEWIINFLNSDSCMLYRELAVINIPEGLSSEYPWNN